MPALGHLRHDDDDVGDRAVRRPQLQPVERVAVAVLGRHGGRAEPRGIRADVGLGQQERRDVVLASRAGATALLLLGAEQHQRLGDADRLVRREQRGERRVPHAGQRERAVVVDLREARARRTPRAPSCRARPSALSPSSTRSGIFASRSISSGSTSASRNARSRARNASPASTAAASSRGCGAIRSSRKRPRNNSLPKLGSFHSRSRAASATSRACRSVTSVDMTSRVPRTTMTLVTLSAPYGAGGSQVGPAVAERLGVPFVDRAIPTAWRSGSPSRCATRSSATRRSAAGSPARCSRSARSGPVLAGATPVPDAMLTDDAFREATEQVLRERARARAA